MKPAITITPKFGYTSPSGRFFCRRPGRGLTGRHALRLECGKHIYTQGYRLEANPNTGWFCKQCFNQLFHPPKPIWLRGQRLKRKKHSWED